MINIPERIRDFNFVLINDDGKKPLEKNWTNLSVKYNNPKLINHLQQNKNYGVNCGKMSSIVKNDKTFFLIIVDFDNKEVQDKVIPLLPETFTTTSGSPKNCNHLWFATDSDKSFKILDEKLNTFADIQGTGKQVIAPGSKHSSGSTYSVVKDIDFAYIPYSELEAILKQFDKSPKKVLKPLKQYIPKETGNDITNRIYDNVTLLDVLKEVGVDTSKMPTNCPLHTSVNGKCLGFNSETAHCFHCDKSWNKFSLLREVKNFNDKQTFEWFAKKAGLYEEYKKSQIDYMKNNKTNLSEETTNNFDIFGRWGQAEEFYKKQPFFFDEHKLFWMWNYKKCCYERIDEVTILNNIMEKMNVGIIESKARTEILNSLKQVGRKKIPADIKPTWIQFKDMIYDIATKEYFKASPNYFVANPIDWRIGDSEDTPEIDKLIKSWVKNADIIRLYELISFVIVPQYFIHSFFFLYGPPGMGKSTFVNLIIKFIGEHNYTTTSIDRINTNPRFETFNWYKKLLICLSEVSNIDDLKNSGLINQATGEDPISHEVKGGETFKSVNYGKFVYPTNKLLKVDEDDGFGRRVSKIDFINRFEKENPVLDNIPPIEFENLAKKCLRIASDLWGRRQFTGDVCISDRMKAYQDVSKTPLERFIDNKCDITDSDSKIKFDDFYAAYAGFLKTLSKENPTKIRLSKDLKKLGFEVKNTNWHSSQVGLNNQNSWESKSTIFGLDIIQPELIADNTLSAKIIY